MQIGLDGVRMVDPATSRTLRIYPLETITRWEVICCAYGLDLSLSSCSRHVLVELFDQVYSHKKLYPDFLFSCLNFAWQFGSGDIG